MGRGSQKTAEPSKLPHQHSAKPDRMYVKVVREAAELLEYVPEWQELADSAIEPNVFYEPWFLLPAMEAFSPEQGLEFVLIFAPDTAQFSGRPRVLCGLFPLERRNHYRRLPVSALTLWRHVHCYLCTPLLKRGYERECIKVFFDFLAEHKARLMEFSWIRGGGPFHQLLVDRFNETAQLNDLCEAYTRALFRPAKNADEYLQSALPLKQRKGLQRRKAQLDALGNVEYRTLQQPQDLQSWISGFLEVEASGWKAREGSALSCNTTAAKFFNSITSAAYQRGRLLMQALYLDEKPIAYRCALLAAPGSFSFKIAFDENYAHFSPGVLLHLENIYHLHECPEIRWMDSCTSPDNSLLNHLWPDRRAIVTVLAGTGRSSGDFIVASFALLRWLKRKKFGRA
jgi:hypothetical protein